jgi:hypothetical protein
VEFGGHVLHRASAEHDLVRGDFDLRRHRQMRRARQQRADCGPCPHRLIIVLGCKSVSVHLSCRQRRAQPRACAKTRLACSSEAQRALFGAVAHIDLVEPRRGVIGLDLGHDPPRQHGWIRFRRCRGERERAVEARRALLERQHAIEIDRERALAGIDIEVHAGAVAILGLPRRHPEWIARAGIQKIAVTADRAGERTHVAPKGDVTELQRAAA